VVDRVPWHLIGVPTQTAPRAAGNASQDRVLVRPPEETRSRSPARSSATTWTSRR